MRLLVIFFSLIWSCLSFACLKVEGDFILNDKKTPINQKVDFGKEYSYMQNDFVLHIKFISHDHKDIQLVVRADQHTNKELKKIPSKIFQVKQNIQHEMIILKDNDHLIKLKLEAKSI